MTKLTMNTQGGYAPQQQTFAPPPPRRALSGWAIAGASFVFLALFAGLIVTTTLLFVQSNQSAQSAATATGLMEPSLPAATETVTRTDVNLLQNELTTAASTAPTPAVVAAVAPIPTQTPEPVVEVASTATVPVRLGRFHRYRVPTCVDYLDTLVKITTVNFPVGGDDPDPADMIRVRNIATAAEMCKEIKVIVEGHSDRRGSEKVNMNLSWYRAQSVIDQLKREGYDVAAMEPMGFGAQRPINLSGTISGEAVNRRVQFALAPRAAPPAGLVNDN